MAVQDNLRSDETLFIIPRGAKTELDTIRVHNITHGMVRFEVYFPEKEYEVVFESEVQRSGGIERYIEEKLSWRKEWRK